MDQEECQSVCDREKQGLSPCGSICQRVHMKYQYRKELEMQALQQLKLFDEQHNVAMEDMLHLRSVGSGLQAQYEEMELEAPEWLTDKMAALTSAIEAQAEAELKRKLREIEGQEDALRTNSERRADLAAQKARIQKKLGVKPSKAA